MYKTINFARTPRRATGPRGDTIRVQKQRAYRSSAITFTPGRRRRVLGHVIVDLGGVCIRHVAGCLGRVGRGSVVGVGLGGGDRWPCRARCDRSKLAGRAPEHAPRRRHRQSEAARPSGDTPPALINTRVGSVGAADPQLTRLATDRPRHTRRRRHTHLAVTRRARTVTTSAIAGMGGGG